MKQLVTAGVRVFFYMEDRERTLDSPTDIAGVAALIVGLPAHLLLSRFRVRSLMAYLIAGVIAAFVFGVWFERLPVTPHPVSWREVLRMAAFALPGGLIAAAIFWRVAVRPSRTSRLPIDKLRALASPSDSVATDARRRRVP